MAWISLYFGLVHSVARWWRASNLQRQFQNRKPFHFKAKWITLQSISASGRYLWFWMKSILPWNPILWFLKEINSQAYSLWQWQKKRTIRALSKGTLGSWFQAVLSDWRVLQSFLMFYLVGIKGSLYEHGCVFEKEMISSWVKKRTVPSSSDPSNVSRKTVFVCQLSIETSKKVHSSLRYNTNQQMTIFA